jgi:hypothetical protein
MSRGFTYKSPPRVSKHLMASKYSNMGAKKYMTRILRKDAEFLKWIE